MAKPTPLRLETLNRLDGGIVARAFDRELARAIADCQERPADNRPRKIMLALSIKPKVDLKTGEVHGAEVIIGAEVSATVPKARSKDYIAATKNTGDAVFHPDLIDSPDGDALFDDDVLERERGERKGE